MEKYKFCFLIAKERNMALRCLNVIRRQYSSNSYHRIEKILIANRGEIACRVMRTAKKLGIRTVAVYSDADISSLHVSMANEAFHIGPPASRDSYLRLDKIIDVAKSSGCQAIHPGYGFLSENTEFANLCQKSDVIFIGPPASSIRDMGIKSTSKKIMASAGVPIIEGYHGEDQSVKKLSEEAHRIGFPIMIKAVCGGGGKGMRIAMTPNEFESQLESAKRESLKAFGDEAMLLERYVQEPRHVEVQVFGDKHGNYVHLFERDCSVQRRHQKIIEEAPAPGVSQELRSELGAAAVRAAKAVGYVGAGTVEFILDRHNLSFHFMEMNTRLQVEHPITEMITGTDLVEWQIKVAAGERLPLTQQEIDLKGHAFEARIYAENPQNNFLPGAGPLYYLSTPPPEEDVRIETGVRQGDEVSVHYDPLIAKLVVWGKDRQEALMKLTNKLREYKVAGLDTNINFLLDLSKFEPFAKGDVHTDFIEQYKKHLLPASKPEPSKQLVIQASLALLLKEKEKSTNIFSVATGFRLNHDFVRNLNFKFNNTDSAAKAKITYKKGNTYSIKVNDDSEEIFVSGTLSEAGKGFDLSSNIANTIHKSHIFFHNSDIHIFDENGHNTFTIPEPCYKSELAKESETVCSGTTTKAPMPGIVDKVWVTEGQNVKAGEPLLVIIAMKMEHVIRSPKEGQINKVLYKAGDSVAKDAVLVQFAESSS